MELTCFERGNSPSRKFIEARLTDPNNLDKELYSVHSKPYTPFVHSKPDIWKKSANRSVIRNPFPSVPMRKSDVVSNVGSIDDTGSNDHRSITDLPRALVSEILQRLEAKELGIVSCVSTFLNDIASDHHG